MLGSAAMRHPLGRLLALMVGSTLAVAGCAGSEPDAVRAGEVYDAVVRWFADARDDDPEPLVIHVERWDDGPLDLAVQAEVVASTAQLATVRFIDTRDEALEWIDDVPTVRHEGLLVRFGPAPERGRQVRIFVDRWVDVDQFVRLEVTVAQQDTAWAVLGESVLSGVVDIP